MPDSDAAGAAPLSWSIMVPSYNGATYLPATLASVVSQLPERVAELEVVDDRSDDGTAEAIASSSSDRVRHHVNEHRQGAIGNFNTCIRRASGDLVHILHADDEVLPEFYERMEAAMRHDGVVAAISRTRYVDEDGRPIVVTRSEQDHSGVWPAAAEVLTVSNRVSPATIVVRRDAYEKIGGFRTDLPHCADWEMWIRLAHHGDIWFENEVLGCYRVHSTSDTAGRIATAANMTERAEVIRLAATVHRTPASGRLQRLAMGYSGLFAGRAALRLLRKRQWRAARAQATAAVRYGVGGVLAPGAAGLPAEIPADSWIGAASSR